MTGLKARLLKNAAANVSRGGAAAVVAILLPPILIRHMQPDAYAVWILVLQVTAYLGSLCAGRLIWWAMDELPDGSAGETGWR